jgi:hypothetical protein
MAIAVTSDEATSQIETAYNCLFFNGVHLQIGQGTSKNEVLDELFAAKVMPRFSQSDGSRGTLGC